MGVLWDLFECWKQKHDIPDRIAVLLKNLLAFRRRALHIQECNNDKVSRDVSGYLSIHYHNKGIDMVNLRRVLNSNMVEMQFPALYKIKHPHSQL